MDDGEWEWSPPPDLTVWVDDDEIVGVIYGPDGEPLAAVMPDRPPFGFTPRNVT